ncbi:hypothetical protein OGAPHI_000121 [Ogataea philodendri]|uniref:Aminotransferase class V domain-containing protein n=1 Tax=Ogataea philodendri TaxID=1378263 RepID=A0A9P8PI42_9ASCO|nr:uncharacterized protein OGAPHI_000121 [Ogataea philodendri]KAH3671935.1 hypothetical protein OGAPHI_000121 [Ogataea philodendri]
MFGHKLKEQFLLGAENNTVNHGSYGAVPKPVWEKYKEFMLQDLTFPDQFTIQEQQAAMVKSLKVIAEFVNTSFENLAFVPNATTGVGATLRSLPLTKEDKLLFPSTIYEACKNNIEYLAEKIGFETTVIELNYPMEDQEVLDLYEAELKTGQYRYCYFDAVTSMPGVRVPFEKLVAMSRQYGALSIVDGAHSVGLIDLDLDAIKPDFFTSNLHKWLFLPRAAAILYVDPKHQSFVQPLPLSHAYKGKKFYERFLFVASNNYSSYLCVEEAIKFRKEVCGGEEKIHEYCKKLADEVLNLLGKDDPFENSTKTLSTAMVNIKIPISEELLAHIKENYVYFRTFIADNMFAENSYVPPSVTKTDLFVRYSCQVYNELEDFKKAHELFLKIMNKYEQSVATK